MTTMVSEFQIDTSRKAQQSHLKTLVELKRPIQKPPIGYDVEKGNFILNDKNAKSIKEVFNLFWDKGRARHRNDIKLISEMVWFYNKDNKRIRKNKKQIRYMLKNKVYIGILSAKFYDEWHIPTETIEYKGTYPPIIDKELFENVEQKLVTSPNGKS